MSPGRRGLPSAQGPTGGRIQLGVLIAAGHEDRRLTRAEVAADRVVAGRHTGESQPERAPVRAGEPSALRGVVDPDGEQLVGGGVDATRASQHRGRAVLKR